MKVRDVLFVVMIALLLVHEEPVWAQPASQPQRRTPPPAQKKRERPPRAQADQWQISLRDLPDRGRPGSFQSFILNKTVSYLVYLPPGYDAEIKRQYPVVYWLPSFSGDCREAAPMMEMFDKAIKLKICPPVIVVGVQGVMGSMYTDARDHGRPIEQVIIKELIGRIDNIYRTIPSREFRGIEGFAMGGFGAAHLAFKYPELFSAVSMFAPPTQTLAAFQEESPDFATDVWNNDQAYFDENDPYILIEKNADKIRGMKIRLLVGGNDRYRVLSEDLHERMDSLKIDHSFKVVPGVRHNLGLLLGPIAHEVFPFWKEAFDKPMPATQPSTRP